MSKLIKYEFIKNRVALLISLGFITFAEILFITGCVFENTVLAASSLVMFIIFGMLLFFTPLVIGITTYTKELSSKAGFLVYMTPNSTYRIVGSKFLFSLLLFIAYSGVFTGYVAIDVAYATSEGLNLYELFEGFESLFAIFGLNFGEILTSTIILIVGVLLTFLMYAAIYYLVYTLTATFLQNNKGRNIISTILFIVCIVILTKIKGMLPDMTFLAENGSAILAGVLPTIIMAIVVIAISWVSCGYMLEKKINL